MDKVPSSIVGACATQLNRYATSMSPPHPNGKRTGSPLMPARARRVATGALLCAYFGTFTQSFAQPTPDPSFDPSIAEPAYRTAHPRVVVDEYHFNYHTIAGRYRPFAALIRNDGYVVATGTERFTLEFLSQVDVLVIANARGGETRPQTNADAFTAAECDAVTEWVRAGGRMLLIADHEPFGQSARTLAARFGVRMGLGHVFDHKQSLIDPTFISYTPNHGLVSDHPITRGRNTTEQVRHVLTFDGQSLQSPSGAVALLTLGPEARESDNAQQLEAGVGRSVGGLAQGIALTYGKGRVVIMGEAAMFSAQVYQPGAPGQGSGPGPGEIRFGMNVPGNDDRQFVLNVMHWLSGAL
jgi:hypothetical protein